MSHRRDLQDFKRMNGRRLELIALQASRPLLPDEAAELMLLRAIVRAYINKRAPPPMPPDHLLTGRRSQG